MSKETDRFFRILVFCLVTVLVGGSFININRGKGDTKPVGAAPITGWRTSVPPENTAIVGFWITEGMPDTPVIVRHGDIYFEYHPGSKYPAPLYNDKPLYWAEMPGGAK